MSQFRLAARRLALPVTRGFAGEAAAAKEVTVELPVKNFGIHARYANATYIAASKAKVLPKVEGELLAFSDRIEKNEAFAQWISNPTIARNEKVATMETLFGDDKKTSYISKNLFVTLAANARLDEADKVVDAFTTLMKAHRKEVEVTITSAEELTKAQLGDVEKALKAQLGDAGAVSITSQVDKSLMGGLTVQIGDKFLDLSVAASINAMEAKLGA